MENAFHSIKCKAGVPLAANFFFSLFHKCYSYSTCCKHSPEGSFPLSLPPDPTTEGSDCEITEVSGWEVTSVSNACYLMHAQSAEPKARWQCLGYLLCPSVLRQHPLSYSQRSFTVIFFTGLSFLITVMMNWIKKFKNKETKVPLALGFPVFAHPHLLLFYSQES